MSDIFDRLCSAQITRCFVAGDKEICEKCMNFKGVLVLANHDCEKCKNLGSVIVKVDNKKDMLITHKGQNIEIEMKPFEKIRYCHLDNLKFDPEAPKVEQLKKEKTEFMFIQHLLTKFEV